MATHFNYSLQNFSMNNAKVLTGNSQPVPDFRLEQGTAGKSCDEKRLFLNHYWIFPVKG